MTSVTASKIILSREEQYCTQVYSNIMAHNHFFHILRFLHFENNDDSPNHDNPDYDRLWIIRNIFDKLNNKFCEMYNPTEHLAVDEVIVLYKGRVVFGQYIPKKQKIWHQNLQTLWLAGLHLWYKRVFRQTKATCHSWNNSNTQNDTASYSKGWGTGPQNFHGQLFHLACSVWWSVSMENQCVWNSSPWQMWNAKRYWTKISKNEKGGHSNMSQGNPKGCLLERQEGCVHSDKHAHSPCWRKFHWQMWPGYQTSCTVHTWGLWTSQTEWSAAMELPTKHGNGPRNCFFT